MRHRFINSFFSIALTFIAMPAAFAAHGDIEALNEPDIMEQLIGSYTEVLLIGYACKDHGASGHQAIVERTIKDFIELGMSEVDAKDTVDSLIATEGPRVAEIIEDEAKKSPEGTNLYCTTAYPEAVSKLDRARIAIANEIRETDNSGVK